MTIQKRHNRPVITKGAFPKDVEILHGQIRGVWKHRYYGVPFCSACTKANNEYTRRYRKAKASALASLRRKYVQEYKILYLEAMANEFKKEAQNERYRKA